MTIQLPIRPQLEIARFARIVAKDGQGHIHYAIR